MKLRRLRLHGFKSFPDRTELEFHDGITAVVGPNGCGKSNIGDAIRWILGEQRASMLRSTRMDDTIFQGTSQRRALNRAEAALVFSNEEGRLPVPHRELEIRRTVFREGGSEYEMNRQPCRLRDILDVCRDTGLGANAYTIIEQRMIDAILSDRAEERRQMFEEAAGIGLYKDRRRGAQRRLDGAQADLTRLEDLIGEVESKVRSLARQSRRAERYTQLRARRLALEVAVATAELDRVRSTLESADRRLEELAVAEPAARAALSTAEAELERHRLESAEALRARQNVAAAAETAAARIAERERELAIADERGAHASARLGQIEAERVELREHLDRLAGERRELEAERSALESSLAGTCAGHEAAAERQRAARQALAEARLAAQAAAAREEELGRRLAVTEADAASAQARAAEADARLERIRKEREELGAELSQLESQGDLFAGRAREAAGEVARLEANRASAAEQLEQLRGEEQEARRTLVAAEDRAARAAARVASLEKLEREFHGFTPAVAAVLAAKDQLGATIAPLADRIALAPELAGYVESTLASLLQTLVVEDEAAVPTLSDWLAENGPEAGALALLPAGALPRVEALLAELRFAGSPEAEPVLIGRRERLESLRADAAAAAAERHDADRARAALAEAVAVAESVLGDAEARLRAAEIELRRAEADEAARSGQRERAERAGQALDAQGEAVRKAADRARSDLEAAREARAALAAELESLRAERTAAAEQRGAREAEWEARRDEESELQIAVARAENELADLERRMRQAEEAAAEAARRLDALDAEEQRHRATLAGLDDVRAGAGGALDELFADRDAAHERLRELDERMAAAGEAAAALESRVRQLRREIEERTEERHRLELERTEAESTRRNVRERLEAEWARPFDQLAASAEPVSGEPDRLRAELLAVSADIERLGPINMLAVEEHEEESKRLEFLTEQRDDLRQARDDLLTAIRQINRTARQLFTETFEQVRVNFRTTFQTLFEGGECDVWLADPDDPLESTIEISASPQGKRTQRIHLLSGGERALTALALLFAIYLVKPSPFCVLDEVDAPLDEANIGRFVAMIDRFKAETQFIIITHNPRTMEAADWIYGVTMEEPGVSSIVGVRLDEAVATAKA